MARPVERRVRQIQAVATDLGVRGVQGAAQTTRALGTTRVGGGVANNQFKLAGLRGLSRGLDEAFRTTMGLAEKDKQGDILEGREAQLEGETLEEQRTRGKQEGFLMAEGKATGLELSAQMNDLYLTGSITDANGKVVHSWDRNTENWNEVGSAFLAKQTKGLPPTSDSEFFLQGMLPQVESATTNLNQQNQKDLISREIADRTTQTQAGLHAQYETLLNGFKNGRLAVNLVPEYKKARQEIITNHVARGGSRADINGAEFNALQGAVLKAADELNSTAVKELLSMANIKRGTDGKRSLAESGYEAQLQTLKKRAESSILSKSRHTDAEERTKRNDRWASFTGSKMSDLKLVSSDPDAVAAARSEWTNLGTEKREELAGPSGANQISGLFDAMTKRADVDALNIRSSQYLTEIRIGKTGFNAMKQRILEDSLMMAKGNGNALLAEMEKMTSDGYPKLVKTNSRGTPKKTPWGNAADRAFSLAKPQMGIRDDESPSDKKNLSAWKSKWEETFANTLGVRQADVVWNRLSSTEKDEMFKSAVEDAYLILDLDSEVIKQSQRDRAKVPDKMPDVSKPVAETTPGEFNLIMGKVQAGSDKLTVVFDAATARPDFVKSITKRVSMNAPFFNSLTPDMQKKVSGRMRVEASQAYMQRHRQSTDAYTPWKAGRDLTIEALTDLSLPYQIYSGARAFLTKDQIDTSIRLRNLDEIRSIIKVQFPTMTPGEKKRFNSALLPAQRQAIAAEGGYPKLVNPPKGLILGRDKRIR